MILGSGRSGTTWVLDALAHANSLRPVFEPLHEGETAIAARYAYAAIQPWERCELLEAFLADAAAGRVHSPWVDYRARTPALFPRPNSLLKPGNLLSWYYTLKRYFRVRAELAPLMRSNETLIKCIRANLMASWLATKMGFRIVLLVRHPCATIESRFQIGDIWDPKPILARYHSDTGLHEQTDGRYFELLNAPLTRIEGLTLLWVIENQLPVANASSHGYAVSFYEQLVSNHQGAWSGLCVALNLENVPSLDRIRKPSQQSSKDFDPARLPVHTPRWRETLTAEQLAQIQGILDTTGCDLYHVNSVRPLQAHGPQ